MNEEIKPVLNYIKTHRQPTDKLYVFQRAIWQFQYYAPKYGYRRRSYIAGVDNLKGAIGVKTAKDLNAMDAEFPVKERRRYLRHLKKLCGSPRVWFVFSQVAGRQERSLIRTELDRVGQKLDEFKAPGVSVSLYDLQRCDRQ